MSFIDAVGTFFEKYFHFSGRAPRSEYWYFILFQIILAVIAVIVDMGVLGGSGFALLALVLILMVPNVTVTVRRLHDIGITGWVWWVQFVPIVGGLILFVLMLVPSQSVSNKYGDNPLDPRMRRSHLPPLSSYQ